jgi:hypothetical protein
MKIDLQQRSADFVPYAILKIIFPVKFILQSALMRYRKAAQKICNTISKSKMISRRQGGGDECTYVEEADDAASKDSALI